MYTNPALNTLLAAEVASQVLVCLGYSWCQLSHTEDRHKAAAVLVNSTGLLSLQAGELEDDEIFFTDKRQSRDHECLSLGCDNQPVLAGRTPVQTYADFIQEFAQQCKQADLWGRSHPLHHAGMASLMSCVKSL